MLKNRNKFRILLFKKFFYKFWKIIYKTIYTFNLHGGIENAGYLSFSIIFAIFPFMIFFTMLIGYFGETNLGTKLIEIMQNSLPNEIVQTIFPVINSVIEGPKASILSIATLTLIWNASSIVQTLKSILDKAFRTRTTEFFLLKRLSSVLEFLLMIFFIITSILITTIIPKIISFLNTIIPINYHSAFFSKKFSFLLLVLSLSIFVTFIYYIFPSKKNKLRNIFSGTILTVVGWLISMQTLKYYLQKLSQFQLVYGSLTGVIITLFFFNIMAMILIFGAEFNYNLVKEFEKEKKNKFKGKK
jgi:membrane protein